MIALFGKFLSKKRLSLKTKSDYIRRVESLKKWLDTKETTLEEITPSQLDEYVNELKDKYKSSTYNAHLYGLKKFFGFMYKEGYTGFDYAEKYISIKVVTKPVEPFTKQEINRLWDSAKDAIDTVLLCFLFLGVRKQSLNKITSDDVTITGNNVTVIVNEKGQKERLLPAPRRTANTLIQLNNDFGLDNLLPIEMSYNGVAYRIRMIGKRANVDNAHPHRYRHTFGHILITNGMDIATVSKMMGHTSIETTMTYLGNSVDYAKRKMRKIDL